MHEYEGKIVKELLLAELEELVVMHGDIVSGYRAMARQVHSSQLLSVMERFANEHTMQVTFLSRYIHRNGGSVASQDQAIRQREKHRTPLAGLVGEVGMCGAIRSGEQKLALEYEKRLRSLSVVDELRAILARNYEAGARRLNEIENIIGRERRAGSADSMSAKAPIDMLSGAPC